MRYNDKGNLVIESKEELLENVIEEQMAQIDEFFLKHDTTHYEVIFKWDERFWKCGYNRSYTNGIEWYLPIECEEMEEKEMVVKKWVIKKEAK